MTTIGLLTACVLCGLPASTAAPGPGGALCTRCRDGDPLGPYEQDWRHPSCRQVTWYLREAAERAVVDDGRPALFWGAR